MSLKAEVSLQRRYVVINQRVLPLLFKVAPLNRPCFKVRTLSVNNYSFAKIVSF